LAAIATGAALALAAAACAGSGGRGGADVPADGAVDAAAEAKDDAWVPVDYGQPETCAVPDGQRPEYAKRIDCLADFFAVAARPPDASIPGARSTKTVIDGADGDALYFQDSEKYPLHYDFAFNHLSGHGLPPVMDRPTFMENYYSPYRRFLLGAVTLYEGPGRFTYEIAPFDTASAEQVTKAYRIVRDAVFFGSDLWFHPTSAEVERLLPDLPADVKVVTTDELFEGISYQPLNLGTGCGQLRFVKSADLAARTVFLGPRDLVVLDGIPDDIAVVAGIVTSVFQTPLSHLNVLSQNRGTPNMGLKGAWQDSTLRALEGGWVKLEVGGFEWKASEIDKAEADAWWEAHKPPAVKVPEIDLTVTVLTDAADIPFPDGIPAFGGKATHYGELTRIGLEKVPIRKAFAVPMHFYRQFEAANGFDVRIAALLADAKFADDPAYRDAQLALLREDMVKAPLDAAFVAAVKAKLDAGYPGMSIKVRSSTNAEDLDGFTGAGLYSSNKYVPGNEKKTLEEAIRKTWASLWGFRAFEERTWRSIDHEAVAMALLVHGAFDDEGEDANGVALTNNIFDPNEPAFWVNVQEGAIEVVKPPPGVVSDQFLYYYGYPSSPTVFIAHSTEVPAGETVLSGQETHQLAKALNAIHLHPAFTKLYSRPGRFYALDVEFKFFTEPGDVVSRLWIKQARPHYGWSAAE
jgi:hypothetical protein